MESPQKRQVTYDETLIERTMSTLINRSMALQRLPLNTPTQRPVDAYASTSAQNHHGHDRPQPHRPDTNWHRPQPSRPDHSWHPAQPQRPDTSWQRPQPTRPDHSWHPAQPQRPDYQTTAYDEYQPQPQDRPYVQNRTFPYQPPYFEQADELYHAEPILTGNKL